MATVPAGIIGQLNNTMYINWLKAARALHCTVDVLRVYCAAEMNTFHRSLVNTLGGTQCSGPCPRSRIVYDRRRSNWSIACPSNVCSQWLSAIVAARAWYRVSLTFKNSNIEEWPIEAWQVAKTYMSPGQDPTVTSSADSDASGILQLITNCRHFGASVRTKADDVSFVLVVHAM